jgi:hypothetical protein
MQKNTNAKARLSASTLCTALSCFNRFKSQKQTAICFFPGKLKKKTSFD